jgi:tRNA(Ile)-lysidine synthase
MLKEFEYHLEKVCACAAGKKFLLAVSGGIDSVVMTHLFHSAGIAFEIAHGNFLLRDKESDGDQEFVEKLADQYKCVIHVTHFDTAGFAENEGLSIQMAARQLRYDWFERIRHENACHFIATGHNRDDVAETFLINLSRGSGIKGLTGIKARQGNLVRPLIFATRDRIRKYACLENLSWREDSSNAQLKYARNRIRHMIIPEFEQINPAFRENVLETIDHLGQSEKLMQMALNEIRENICTEMSGRFIVDIEKLRTLPAVETILFELFRDYDCTASLVHTMLESLDKEPGRQFITRTHTITLDRSHLIVTKNGTVSDTEVIIGAETEAVTFPIALRFSSAGIKPGFSIPVEKHTAILDRNLLEFPLILRRWKPGDSFHPLGMNGSKKISDFLIDNKVPLPDKQHIRVIESGGKIAWIVNHRIDDRYKVTAGTTNIYRIEYSEQT